MTKSNLEDNRKDIDFILEMLDSGVYSQKQAKKYILALFSQHDKTTIGNFSKKDIARITAQSSIDQMKAHEKRIIEVYNKELAEKAEGMKITENAQEDQSVASSVYYKQQRNIGYNQALDDIIRMVL